MRAEGSPRALLVVQAAEFENLTRRTCGIWSFEVLASKRRANQRELGKP